MVFAHALPPEGQERLASLKQRLAEKSSTLVGYPCNQVFDYSELYPFLAYSVNNLGDPYADSNYRVNTHDFEREVIDWFAKLTHAKADDVWGYITNGGTEGNMYGLYLGRELFPQGVVYFSEDTHYSVVKILHVLGVRNIMIRSQENGEMDYEDLAETLRIHRDVPPIIFANIGTTMKGAVDNVPKIKELLKRMAIQSYYIHADAALSGMILPFVENPQPFDFAQGADSISISGHKMIGCPIPCGVALAKKRNVNRIGRTVEYVGALDTTINGSRNGITPLMLWYAVQRMGISGFQAAVKESIALSDYAIEVFAKLGVAAWRNENSITVVFPRPSDETIAKWQLAPYQDIAHIITVPHLTRTVIDTIIRDVAADITHAAHFKKGASA